MSPRTLRRLWWVNLGLWQLLLAWVAADALYATDHHRPVMMDCCGGGCSGTGYVSRGRPVVWQLWTRGEGYHWRSGGPTVFDPPVWAGQNMAVPVAGLLLAGCLPAVVFGPAVRAARAGGPKPSAGRPERLARVGVVAAVAGLLTAAVELETSHLGPFDGVTPANLTAAWFDRQLPGVLPPGAGWELHRLLPYGTIWDVRRSVFGDERVAGDAVAWRRRTLLTAWAMLCCGGAAADWWRPWRAVTTPPRS